MTDNFENKVAVDGPVVNEGELGSSTFTTGQVSPAGPLGLGQRWTVTRKREVALRLLRGEPVELLSRQLGVEIFRLEQWREKAIAGIDASLKERKGDPVKAELDIAMKRIGELIRRRIRGTGTPLAPGFCPFLVLRHEIQSGSGRWIGKGSIPAPETRSQRPSNSTLSSVHSMRSSAICSSHCMPRPPPVRPDRETQPPGLCTPPLPRRRQFQAVACRRIARLVWQPAWRIAPSDAPATRLRTAQARSFRSHPRSTSTWSSVHAAGRYPIERSVRELASA